jgi:hypothetical protein
LSRALVVAGGRALLVLGFLLAPWPGLGRAFVTACCAPANVVQPTVGGVALELAPAPARLSAATLGPSSSWQAVLTLRNIHSGAATRSALNLRALVFVPFAIVGALLIAVPARQGSASVALLTLALVAAFVLIGVVAPVALLLDEPRIGALVLGEPGRSLLRAVFVVTAETSLEAPTLLWFFARGVVAFLYDDRE